MGKMCAVCGNPHTAIVEYRSGINIPVCQKCRPKPITQIFMARIKPNILGLYLLGMFYVLGYMTRAFAESLTMGVIIFLAFVILVWGLLETQPKRRKPDGKPPETQ